ncbi:hypothetical protein ElyMa_003918000 [Elysia marginata]|uniref:Uncharacterized protein n=1 Tax=Elysia marginata TaxID=1093978 RepID=A0AAV4FSQ2_9GAST|nr:hypothetical protein ElyMa_003918000 [Elysia marginata]
MVEYSSYRLIHLEKPAPNEEAKTTKRTRVVSLKRHLLPQHHVLTVVKSRHLSWRRATFHRTLTNSNRECLTSTIHLCSPSTPSSPYAAVLNIMST